MALLLAIIGGVVLVGGSVTLAAIVNGFVLSTLWGWFIVPTFLGAPELGIVPAIGISLVVNYMTSHYTGKDDRSIGAQFTYMVMYPALALLIGWIVHLFM